MQRLKAAALLAGAATALHAGSVDNRNNNSADYIRSLSRNSSLEGADIAIYNPAGTVRLPDGLHLSLSNQTVSKFNRHAMRSSPFKEYESEITSPLYPTAFAIYKQADWAAFGAFSFPGGGGELRYDKGSNTVALIQTNLEFMNPPRNAEAYLRSVYYGGTLGGAWQPKPWISLAFGIRALYARTDITVDGDTVLAPGNTSKIIDHMEEARGYTAVMAADFWPTPKLTLALRLEGPTSLEWEVQKSTLNLDNVIQDPTIRGRFTSALRATLRSPGSTFMRDLPANVGLGAGYAILPALRADLSVNYYLNTLADWDGKEDDHSDGWEAALGMEYAFPFGLRASAGGMYTVTGADSESYSVENPALDSYTLGAGGKYAIGPRLGITGAFAANIALDDEVKIVSPAGTSFADLEKYVLVYALGIEYRLF
jgi:long-chain fatty acid transport protein